MQYIIDLGKQLVNSLKYIEKRTNMKVKTSFLNLFVFDDIYTLDSIPEVLIFLAGAPKGLYDAKTDDKEKEIKKLTKCLLKIPKRWFDRLCLLLKNWKML